MKDEAWLALGVLAVVALLSAAGEGIRRVLGYVNGTQVPLDMVAIDEAGHLLRLDAAAAFASMQAAATAAGAPLHVDSAFRTQEQQDALYQLYLSGKGNLAAEPGYSNHQGGVAVDIDTAGGTNAQFTWLTAHAGDYRFRRTVASEPWHWEYA